MKPGGHRVGDRTGRPKPLGAALPGPWPELMVGQPETEMQRCLGDPRAAGQHGLLATALGRETACHCG